MEGVGLFVNLSVTLILISILVSIWSLMMMLLEGVLWVCLQFDEMIYRHCRHDDMVGGAIL